MLGYIVVSTNTVQKLVEEVNDLIKMGWEPLGGIAVTELDCSQAMTKDIVRDVISEEFTVKEKGLVPGEFGPEYVFHYEYKGKRNSLNLGKSMRNYTDEELFEIVKGLEEE